MTMKIFYDYQAFVSDTKFGGVSRYFVEIFKRLEIPCIISILKSQNYYIKEIKSNIYDIFPHYSFKGKRRIRIFINKVYTLLLLLFKRYDIIHLTGEKIYPHYLIRNKPIIVTIHDCTIEHITNNSQPLHKRVELFKRVSHIIAVSQNTKNDILNLYPFVPPENITVIYHGANNFKVSTETNPYGKYILYIGGRGSYKNWDNLLYAFQTIIKELPSIKLICSGSKFTFEEKKQIDKLGLSNNIVNLQCCDKELIRLYTHAVAFIYPSKYEGFGIPILEAWELQCPVLLSNTSCFPEIANNGGIYFDPNDINSIVSAIKEIIFDTNKRKELIDKGNENLKNYSWQKSAKLHQEVYKKVYKDYISNEKY